MSEKFFFEQIYLDYPDLHKAVDDDGYSIMDYTIDYQCTGAHKIFLLVQAGAKNNSRFQEDIQGTYDDIMNAPEYKNQFNKLWQELNRDYNKIYRKQLIELKKYIECLAQ